MKIRDKAREMRIILSSLSPTGIAAAADPEAALWWRMKSTTAERFNLTLR